MYTNAFVARLPGIRYWFFSNADQSTAEVFAMRRTVRHDVNRKYGRNVFFLVLIALIMTAITVGSVYLFDYWAGYTKVGLP
jgi:hypothetical protein